jgi:hypothetical protein
MTWQRATEAATRIDLAYDSLLTGTIQLWQSREFDGSPIPEELVNRLHPILDDLDRINQEVRTLLKGD